MCEQLLSFGAFANAKDRWGSSPLDDVLRRRKPEQSIVDANVQRRERCAIRLVFEIGLRQCRALDFSKVVLESHGQCEFFGTLHRPLSDLKRLSWEERTKCKSRPCLLGVGGRVARVRRQTQTYRGPDAEGGAAERRTPAQRRQTAPRLSLSLSQDAGVFWYIL